MQEEVENRAVTLVISATKLTGRLLKAAILKYLASRKEKRLQKARAAPEKPTGKQTVKQLIGQNQGVSNIEITDSNIKSFERVAPGTFVTIPSTSVYGLGFVMPFPLSSSVITRTFAVCVWSEVTISSAENPTASASLR